jgi:hypothetical protein
VSKLSHGQIAYGALCDERGKMVDDCTTMMRPPDSVRFCGANDRDYEIFSAKAAALGIDVREVTDAIPHLCLQGPKSREILQGMEGACQELMDGKLHDQFRLDVFQGGAGTSTNMNANEVIANRALELMGCEGRVRVRPPSATQSPTTPATTHVGWPSGTWSSWRP